MRALLANLYLGIVLLLYAASLVGVLFVSQAAMVLGVFGFCLMFIVGVIRHRFRRQPFHFKRLWAFVFPAFAILFLSTILLSFGRGAPKTGGLAVFARRERYLFTRGEEVSRARFVAVGTCFNLAWHIFGMAFSLEEWASIKAGVSGRSRDNARG